MNWRIKGTVQKVLSSLPQGVRVNNLLQCSLGGLRRFDHELDMKVEDWRLTNSYLAELGICLHGLRFMEVGTGWFPAFPICFALAGAARCDTFDLTRHLSAALTRRMLVGLSSHLPKIATALNIPLHRLKEQLESWTGANNIDAMFGMAQIQYHAPADASRSGLADASVDVAYSNSVLEHVPRPAINDLMREAARVLRPGGVMVHCINCGDHYAYFDRKINAVNYLTYTESQWRRWNNSLLYQNRMRPQDFLDLAEDSGFDIALERHKPRQELINALPQMKIAPEFQHYAAEQLCCTSVDFVARKR